MNTEDVQPQPQQQLDPVSRILSALWSPDQQFVLSEVKASLNIISQYTVYQLGFVKDNEQLCVRFAELSPIEFPELVHFIIMCNPTVQLPENLSTQVLGFCQALQALNKQQVQPVFDDLQINSEVRILLELSLNQTRFTAFFTENLNPLLVEIVYFLKRFRSPVDIFQLLRTKFVYKLLKNELESDKALFCKEVAPLLLSSKFNLMKTDDLIDLYAEFDEDALFDLLLVQLKKNANYDANLICRLPDNKFKAVVKAIDRELLSKLLDVKEFQDKYFRNGMEIGPSINYEAKFNKISAEIYKQVVKEKFNVAALLKQLTKPQITIFFNFAPKFSESGRIATIAFTSDEFYIEFKQDTVFLVIGSDEHKIGKVDGIQQLAIQVGKNISVYLDQEQKVQIKSKFRQEFTSLKLKNVTTDGVYITQQPLSLCSLRYIQNKQQPSYPIFDIKAANLICQQIFKTGYTLVDVDQPQSKIIQTIDYEDAEILDEIKGQLILDCKNQLGEEIITRYNYNQQYPPIIYQMLEYYGKRSINQLELTEFRFGLHIASEQYLLKVEKLQEVPAKQMAVKSQYYYRIEDNFENDTEIIFQNLSQQLTFDQIINSKSVLAQQFMLLSSNGIDDGQQKILYQQNPIDFCNIINAKLLLRKYFQNIIEGKHELNHQIKSSLFENKLIICINELTSEDYDLLAVYTMTSGMNYQVNLEFIQLLITHFLHLSKHETRNNNIEVIIKILQFVFLITKLMDFKMKNLNPKNTQNFYKLVNNFSLDYQSLQEIVASYQSSQSMQKQQTDAMKYLVVQIFRIIEQFEICDLTGKKYFDVYYNLHLIVLQFWPNSEQFVYQNNVLKSIKINMYRFLEFNQGNSDYIIQQNNQYLNLLVIEFLTQKSQKQELNVDLFSKVMLSHKNNKLSSDTEQSIVQNIDLPFLQLGSKNQISLGLLNTFFIISFNQLQNDFTTSSIRFMILAMQHLFIIDYSQIQLLNFFNNSIYVDTKHEQFYHLILKILCIRLGDVSQEYFDGSKLTDQEYDLIKKTQFQIMKHELFDSCFAILQQFCPKFFLELAFLFTQMQGDTMRSKLSKVHLVGLLTILSSQLKASKMSSLNEGENAEQIEVEVKDYQINYDVNKDPVLNYLSTLKPKKNLFLNSFNDYKQQMINTGQVTPYDPRMEEAALILYIGYKLKDESAMSQLVKAYINEMPTAFANICFKTNLLTVADKLKNQILIIQQDQLPSELNTLLVNDTELGKYVRQITKQSLDQFKQGQQVVDSVSRMLKKIQTVHKQWEDTNIILKETLKYNTDELITILYCNKRIKIYSTTLYSRIYQLLVNYESKSVIQSNILQTKVGRVQLRENNNFERNYQQLLFENERLSNMYNYICKSINNTQYASVSQFIQPGQKIICVGACQRSLPSSLTNQNGVLVITNCQIVFIPDCVINSTQKTVIDSNEYQARKQVSTELSTFDHQMYQIYNTSICDEHQRQVITQFFAFNCDPELILEQSLDQSLLRTVVFNPQQILSVIPRQHAHRESSLEFIMNSHYSFNFDFYDHYTSEKKNKAFQNSKLNAIITAEFTRGIVCWTIKEIFQINSNCICFKPSIVNSLLQLKESLFSVLGNVMVWPYLFKGELKQLLIDNINAPAEKYVQVYKNYWLDYFEEYVVQQELILPLISNDYTSPIAQATHFNADALIKQYSAKNIYQAAAMYIYELFSNQIISSNQFLIYINILAGRSVNDLSAYPIYPICKNRNFNLPVQAQMKERITTLKQRAMHVKDQLDPAYLPKSAFNLFNQEIFVNGTFCSNSASTVYYLFRQQPYTTALIDLQAGKFDAADRMFHSYKCLREVVFETNYKEWIQQVFGSIKIQLNLFQYDIGVRQNGKIVGDLDFTIDETHEEYISRSQSNLSMHRQSVDSRQPIKLELQPNDQEETDEKEEEFNIQSLISTETVPDSIPVEDVELAAVEQQPSNVLSLLMDLNKNLDSIDKIQMYNWIQLFFGKLQNSDSHYNQYPVYSYYLKITDATLISQEIDKVTYFGSMPNSLFDKNHVNTEDAEVKEASIYSLKYEQPLKQITIDNEQYYEGQVTMNNSEYVLQRLLGKKAQVKPIIQQTSAYMHFTHNVYYTRTQFEVDFYAKNESEYTHVYKLMSNKFIRDVYSHSNILIMVTHSDIRIVKFQVKSANGSTKQYTNIQIQSQRVLDLQVSASAFTKSQVLIFSVNGQTKLYDILNDQVLGVIQNQFVELKLNENDWIFGRTQNEVLVYSNELVNVGRMSIEEHQNYFPFGQIYDESIIVVYKDQYLYRFGYGDINESCEYIAEPAVQSGKQLHILGCQFEQLNAEPLLNNTISQNLTKYGDFELKKVKETKYAQRIVQVCASKKLLQIQFEDGTWITKVK
ncbi:Beige/BEACH_domain-containing protein [Hexamita inflata]|uniref:Beige/BEACH domain-containing protein n=1 Tax=Hexamita inflata TaxID=28002 RepID=A0AA86NQT9_9EUKA|nr:Beige/BEACH domain-containing protein [Hexamita inflata]